jgi:class 3 adenylate cyclase
MAPDTQFARTADGAYVAYQVTGTGPFDVVVLRAWVTNVEHEWEEPTLARMMKRLAGVGRLIRLDRRGMGLSDRIATGATPTLESRLDDVLAVMDAAASRQAVLVGLASGSALCTLFAASHPERTRGLVLYHPALRGSWAPDYPWGATPTQLGAGLAGVASGWGTQALAERWIAGGAPSRATDRALIDWLAADQRLAGSAEDAQTLLRIEHETDVRAAAGSIHVPTLVITRAVNAEESRDAAHQIPGARLIELPGQDHMALAGDTDAVLREMTDFVVNVGEASVDDDRVLATVMFADLVNSTALAAQLGDRAWSHLLDEFRLLLRPLVARFAGREVDLAGDGYFAAFDGPGRAIRCALACVTAVRELGLEVRIGLHTGECERAERTQLRGLAVHIGARVSAMAGPSEVVVSGTVRDLVAGSGLEFESRGVHVLKGVPGEWPLYLVHPGWPDRRMNK